MYEENLNHYVEEAAKDLVVAVREKSPNIIEERCKLRRCEERAIENLLLQKLPLNNVFRAVVNGKMRAREIASATPRNDDGGFTLER